MLVLSLLLVLMSVLLMILTWKGTTLSLLVWEGQTLPSLGGGTGGFGAQTTTAITIQDPEGTAFSH